MIDQPILKCSLSCSLSVCALVITKEKYITSFPIHFVPVALKEYSPQNLDFLYSRTASVGDWFQHPPCRYQKNTIMNAIYCMVSGSLYWPVLVSISWKYKYIFLSFLLFNIFGPWISESANNDPTDWRGGPTVSVCNMETINKPWLWTCGEKCYLLKSLVTVRISFLKRYCTFLAHFWAHQVFLKAYMPFKNTKPVWACWYWHRICSSVSCNFSSDFVFPLYTHWNWNLNYNDSIRRQKFA